MSETQVPTLFDWLGGLPALLRLTERFISASRTTRCWHPSSPT